MIAEIGGMRWEDQVAQTCRDASCPPTDSSQYPPSWEWLRDRQHPSSPLTDGMPPAQVGRTVVKPSDNLDDKACGGRAQRASSSRAGDEHQGGQGGWHLGTRAFKLRRRRSTGCSLGRQTLGFPVHGETVRAGCAGSNNDHGPQVQYQSIQVCFDGVHLLPGIAAGFPS